MDSSKNLLVGMVSVGFILVAGFFVLRNTGTNQQAAAKPQLLVGLVSESLAVLDNSLPGGLREGDLVSAVGSDDPDIYIVNEHGYKRLFLNPVIFGFYGHLGGFQNVKPITPVVRDAFITSGLFRNCETADQKVYGVQVSGEDTGILHWVNTSGAQAVADDPSFFKKVFCINTKEFSWYPMGTTFTSVAQVPSYARAGTSPTLTPMMTATPMPTGPVFNGQFDAASPTARLIGDEQSVIAVRLKFSASIDSFDITRINLDIPDASGITEVKLWHENELVMALPASTDLTFDIPQNKWVRVIGGQSETIDVELVLGTIGQNAGLSGADHTVTLDKSESRSRARTTGSEEPMSGADIVGEPLFAYKAVPFITRLDLPNSILAAGGATNTIARFSVGSGGTGDITFKRMMFTYTLGDTLSGLSTIQMVNANTGSVIMGTVSSTSNTFTFSAANDLPSGDYLVKARVNGTADGNDYVAVSLPSGGAGYASPAALGSVPGTATFVWSDLSGAPHSDTSLDWNNDHLVKYLPLDSWSLQD